MLDPEDQQRTAGESAEEISALETALLALGAGALVGLAAYTPKAVNKAAAQLRNAAGKAAAQGMGAVYEAVERDLTGHLVLSAIDDASHAEDGARKARTTQRAVEDARKQAKAAAREVQRQTRRFAACMVNDLNQRFLREAYRARARTRGTESQDGVNHRAAMTEAVTRLAKDGLTAYTYERKDGATVHVPADVGIRRYVDNAGKTRALEQTAAIAKRSGANLVEVSTTAGARKSHAKWQGKRYLLRGSSERYENFYKACKKGDPVDGIGGYNCRHQVAICRENEPSRFKDPLEGTGYTQAQAREALAQQRAMENDLRRLKRQREVLASQKLDTKEVNARIKAVTANLEDHVAKHSAVLRRDRHRESIYQRARKAVGAEGQVWLDAGQRAYVESLRDATAQWRKRAADAEKNAILEGKQKNHIKGTNEFAQRTKSAQKQGYPSQSYLIITMEEAQELALKHAGKGTPVIRNGRWHRGEEVCKAGHVVGRLVDRQGNEEDTEWFTIHYAAEGVHVVPARKDGKE